MLKPKVVGKFKLESCLKSHAGRIRIRSSNFLILADQINSLIIPDYKAFKTNSLPKYIGEDPGVYMAGQSIHFIKCCHYGSGACRLNHMAKGGDFMVE